MNDKEAFQFRQVLFIVYRPRLLSSLTLFQFRQVLFIAVTKIAIINENTRLFTILTWHFFIYKVVDPQLYKNNRESTTYIIDLIFNMSKNVLKHREVLYTHFLLIKTDIDNFHKN